MDVCNTGVDLRASALGGEPLGHSSQCGWPSRGPKGPNGAKCFGNAVRVYKRLIGIGGDEVTVTPVVSRGGRGGGVVSMEPFGWKPMVTCTGRGVGVCTERQQQACACEQ
eukprot:scaffold25739_cov118-Isochrysis_galbana.AAC.1